MNTTKSVGLKTFIPVILSFFVMGIVDLVGLATNNAKKDFALDDLTVTIIPMMVFLWFAVCSIPTGLLMNKIGRKNTVLIATLITLISLLIPFFFYHFYTFVFAFALLGIGNTIIQVSLNPLVASLVSGDKVAGTLTFGQFVKAISSFLGPIIAGFTAKQFGDWKLVFILYAAVSLLSLLWLYATPIQRNTEETENQTSFGSTLALLKDKVIFQLFLGIIVLVGIDVCMNVYSPQLLVSRLSYVTEEANLGSSLYFFARTLGAFLGSFILMRLKPNLFLKGSMAIALFAMGMLMFAQNEGALFAGIVLIGLTCANVFSIIFTFAMQHKPTQTNEVSALMIMGVAGGAIIPPIAGLLTQNMGLAGTFGLLLLCVGYIFFLSVKFAKK